MEIINIGELKPIYTRHEVPTFRTQRDKDAFFDEENRRCLEGYEGMPGTLYEYTQWQKIKDRTSGHIFHPQCREVDLFIHEKWAESIKRGHNLFLGKARGVGLSVMGCALANYYIRNFPGVNSLITSKDSGAIEEIFIEKVLVTYDSYIPELKSTEIKRTQSKNNCALRVSTEFYDEYDRIQHNESKIVLRETSQNPRSPTGFSAYGGKFGFYDELPLHARREKLIRSSEYCYYNKHTNKKEGNIFSGGTLEETLTNENILSFMKFIGAASLYKFDVELIPFWMAAHLYPNGRWNEKYALEQWDKEYELIAKDKDLARAYRLNNPRSWDDILELTSGSRFSEGINDLIKEQDKYLEKVEEGYVINVDGVEKQIAPQTLFVSIKIVDSKKNGDETIPIHTEPSKDSALIMFEPPQPHLNYFCTIDGTGTGTKSGNVEGSKWCTYIFKEYDPKDGGWCPVMKWMERPEDPPSAVKKSLLMCRYYDIYGNFQKIWAEGNRGMESAYDLLVSKGYERFISYTKNIEKGNTLGSRKPWQYMVADNGEHFVNRATEFLPKHIGSIKDRHLLKSMLEPVEENVDDWDSYRMMFVGYRFIDDEREESKPAMVKTGKWVQDAGGIWKKIYSTDLKRNKEGLVIDDNGNAITEDSFLPPVY